MTQAFENHRGVKARDLSFDGIGERLMYVNLNISKRSPLYLGTLSDSSDQLRSALDDALALDSFRDAEDELSLKFPVEVLTGYDVRSMRDRFDISYEDFQRKHQHDEWTPDERELFEGFLRASVSKKLRVDGVEVDATIQHVNFDFRTGALEECRGPRLATTAAPRRRSSCSSAPRRGMQTVSSWTARTSRHRTLRTERLCGHGRSAAIQTGTANKGRPNATRCGR